MPFGLKNASSAVQRAMRINLQNSQFHDVKTYVGDIKEEARQLARSLRDLSKVFNNLCITP